MFISTAAWVGAPWFDSLQKFWDFRNEEFPSNTNYYLLLVDDLLCYSAIAKEGKVQNPHEDNSSSTPVDNFTIFSLKKYLFGFFTENFNKSLK